MSLIMDVLAKPKSAVLAAEGSKKLENFFNSPGPQRPSVRPGSPGPRMTGRPASALRVLGMLLAFAGAAFLIYLAVSWYHSRSVKTPALKRASLAEGPSISFSSRPASRPSASESDRSSPSVVQGVVLDGIEPLCLIKGRVFKIGDSLEDKKITAITDQGVSLADEQGNASFIGITK